MKKRLWAGVLVVALVVSLAPGALAAQREVLTLEAAQEYALANSPWLKLGELEYQEKSQAASAANREYEDARRNITNANYGLWSVARAEGQVRDSMRDLPADDPLRGIFEQELRLINQTATAIKDSMDNLISARRQLDYVASLAKADQDRARRQLADRKLILARDVEDRYYQLLLLERNQQALQDQLDHLIQLQQIEHLKISLGLSPSLSVRSLGTQAEEVGHLLRELSTVRRWARQDFNQLLGRGLDEPLFLSDDITTKADPVLHPGYGDRYVQNSTAREILAKQIEVQKDRLQDLENEYSKGDPRYREAEITLERLQLQYAQADDSFRMAVVASYNRTQQAEANLRAQEAQLRLAQAELNTATLQYQLGLISKQELELRQRSVKDIETRYHQGRFNYNLAVTDYQLSLEGIIVSP